MMYHSQQSEMVYVTVCLDHAFFQMLGMYEPENKCVKCTIAIVQCPERQRVENFGVLRSDAL
jgi:hypothetical protein